MKCAFPEAKIAAPIETAKRNLLKDVKGFEKERLSTSTGRGRFGGVWTEGTGPEAGGVTASTRRS